MASILALRLSEAYECLLEGGGGFMTTSFFAAWSTASFSGTCVWLGTQQICTEPPSVYISFSRASQVEARAMKDSKTSYNKPMNGDRVLSYCKLADLSWYVSNTVRDPARTTLNLAGVKKGGNSLFLRLQGREGIWCCR
jgi:hypothetical protein